jgi:hypothetical protein
MKMLYIGDTTEVVILIHRNGELLSSDYRLVQSLVTNLCWYCHIEKLVPVTSLLEALC